MEEGMQPPAEEHREKAQACTKGSCGLTDAERGAIAYVANCDCPGPDNTQKPDTAPSKCSVVPEWMSRPFWVDPPQGWRYGFPKLYVPAKGGDMTEWMIRNGYPETLARKGLPCTFTATDHS